MANLDLLFAASLADQQRQLRSLAKQDIRYRGHLYRVIDAIGEGEDFGLMLQESHAAATPVTLIVSGDDLRLIQLP